ncbi:hypothetical protein AB0M05_41205 [Streptomyces violaceusniger]|uniref:hypothetical protein n=1 Tax=Streptomyces violaceusniger TaxID=68280 RepID=UPI003442ED81
MSLTVPAPHVPYDPRRLAAFLTEHGMPGQRSMTAITRLRRERINNRPVNLMPRPLAERLRARIIATAVAEIGRRGGETEIVGDRSSVGLHLADRDPATRTVLLRAEGWRYYSRRFGARHTTLAYVHGADDAGPWAVRVPGTLTTLAEALAWMEPAEVTKARAAGRRVRRQGDVYAIETTAAHDGRGSDALPEAHQWRPQTRYLVHRPEDGRRHRPLKLPYPVRFVRQRVLEMGRSGGRAYGD